MYLNCHTFYSFKYGTLSPQRLLDKAEELGIDSLVITDINNTSACWEIYALARNKGIKLCFGIDFRNENISRFIAIAQNPDGFEEINRYLSYHALHNLEFPERAPEFKHAFVVYPFQHQFFFSLREKEFMGIQISDLNRFTTSVWRNYLHKCLALLPVNFISRKDYQTHRILSAMRNNTMLSHLDPGQLASHTHVFMPKNVLYQKFAAYPKLLDNARSLLQQCSMDMDFSTPKNKKFFFHNAETDIEMLRHKAEKGAIYRYGKITSEIKARMEKELDIIIRKDFVAYFLINEDIIRFATQRGFFHVGRGSGANSLIAYCLGITNVDPMELDLYFERFINLHRSSAPDFDIDFSWKDRDEVIAYLLQKYGEEHACQLAAFNTIQAKSAIRELCKVAGLPKSEAELFIRNFRKNKPKGELENRIYTYAEHLTDFPSHLSIHAGGILISEEPIYRYTATHFPPKGFPVSRFDMHTAENIGLYKFDILSQRGLGHIKDTVNYVKQRKGIEIDIHNTKPFFSDPEIVDLLQTGNTMGCFYVESPAMRTLLQKLKCKTYPELVAASSIIRPGVARSGMMRTFIQRHRYPESRKEMHPVLAELMPDTYGVMVYQEDVIKVAHHFGELSLAEADVLRRGMSGKSRSKDEFNKVKNQFFFNCNASGKSILETEMIWKQMESFAGYSFAKGHSASFAVESYQSLYLKAKFPLEFYTAVINNFGGFYRTAFYIHEMRKFGAQIELPCINHSNYLSSLQYEKTLFIGFGLVHDLDFKVIETLTQERNNNGPFLSLEDLVERMRNANVLHSLDQLLILIRVGALRCFQLSKQHLLWKAHLLYQKMNHSKRQIGSQTLFEKPPLNDITLPRSDTGLIDDVKDELELLGFPVQLSYFDLVADKPDHYDRISMVKSGQKVCLLGWLVTYKPLRTVKGELMIFGTFLDEDGRWIDTVHFPDSAANYPFAGEGVYLIEGYVSEEFDLLSIEVSKMKKLALI